MKQGWKVLNLSLLTSVLITCGTLLIP